MDWLEKLATVMRLYSPSYAETAAEDGGFIAQLVVETSDKPNGSVANVAKTPKSTEYCHYVTA